MLAITCLFALVAAAQAQQIVYDISKNVDNLLPQINDYMTKKGLQTIRIPDFGYEAAPVFINVFLKNVSTIYRTGKAEMWQSGREQTTFRMNLSLKDMQLHVELCPFLHDSFTWTINDASVEVEFTWLTNRDLSCTTEWHYFKITKLDDIVMTTTNAEWNHKSFPKELMDDVVSHYNVLFKDPRVLEVVQKSIDICNLK